MIVEFPTSAVEIGKIRNIEAAEGTLASTLVNVTTYVNDKQSSCQYKGLCVGLLWFQDRSDLNLCPEIVDGFGQVQTDQNSGLSSRPHFPQAHQAWCCRVGEGRPMPTRVKRL
jgi:hypothetical protein